MITNFAIIGKDCDKTIESIKQFDNIGSVSILKDRTLLNKSLEKPCDYLVLCDAGDTFSENYISVCSNLIQTELIIGAVYTDLIVNRRICLPSFCRQRIVKYKAAYPINCFIKRELIPKDFFKTGFATELFLKFSHKFAMYHIAEPLVIKEKWDFENLNKELLEEIYEHSHSDW